jgi:DNA-3-methyladenine glycosylase II
LFGNRQPQPEDVLGLPLETLRQIGLSESKAGYMIHLARFALEQGLSVKKLSRMDDEAVIDYLTQIKGVGRWTAEMVMMFALGREDVFAVDDLGIQQAMIKLFQLDGTDKKKLKEDMLRISRKWSPYRTYACLHLWAWKDNK